MVYRSCHVSSGCGHGLIQGLNEYRGPRFASGLESMLESSLLMMDGHCLTKRDRATWSSSWHIAALVTIIVHSLWNFKVEQNLMICFTRLVFKRVEPPVYFILLWSIVPQSVLNCPRKYFSLSPGRRDAVNIEP